MLSSRARARASRSGRRLSSTGSLVPLVAAVGRLRSRPTAFEPTLLTCRLPREDAGVAQFGQRSLHVLHDYVLREATGNPDSVDHLSWCGCAIAQVPEC